jgi:hypothetical protein
MNKFDDNLKYKEYDFTLELYYTYKNSCVLMLHDKVISSFTFLCSSNGSQGFCLYTLEDEDFVGYYSVWKVKIFIPIYVERVPYVKNITNIGIYYKEGDNYFKVNEMYTFNTSPAIAITTAFKVYPMVLTSDKNNLFMDIEICKQ